ncbi:C-C motif chemokine 20-like [Protopterus annectens]|uniref:C-C motif chemokine 20-like n=1 Tax=Protopterus annectens TaxID=7888 RepID=UPI001CFAA4B5|nr:C-C motif chemokine 20-like [Protopterus annectens]
MQLHLKNRAAKITIILILINLVPEFATSYLRPSKVIYTCCTSVSRNRFTFNITHFREQRLQKPCVSAIIFYTKEKGAICSDPSAKWVKKKVKELSQKQK